MAGARRRIDPWSQPTRRRVIRRRRAGALAILLALPAAAPSAIGGLTPQPPATIALELDGRPAGQLRVRDAQGRALTATVLARSLPPTATVRAGAASITYALDRRRAARQITAARADAVALPGRPRSATVRAPVVAQRLRGNCETAALQVLLATTGIRIDQLVLQRRLARSGTLDPQPSASGPIWGDPDEGYVGRAEGGGSWGGFGVYPRPIAALAARHGRRLRDLTGASPSAVYRSLLTGRAVLAWIGLADGPYRSWRTSAGRQVSVNLNEHTIVLHGIRADGTLQVVNVLEGTRELWSAERFEAAWELLGRRALAAS